MRQTQSRKVSVIIVACLSLIILFPINHSTAGLLLKENAVEPDTYEEDDTFSQANVIVLNDEPQHHNFHDAGDEDWVKFYGIDGEQYTIKVTDLRVNCDAVIELYDENGTTLLDLADDSKEGDNETLDWIRSENSVYYVKIRHYDPELNRFAELYHDRPAELSSSSQSIIIFKFNL